MLISGFRRGGKNSTLRRLWLNANADTIKTSFMVMDERKGGAWGVGGGGGNTECEAPWQQCWQQHVARRQKLVSGPPGMQANTSVLRRPKAL